MVDSIFGKQEPVATGQIRDPPPAAVSKRVANGNGDIKKPNGYTNGHINGYANGYANGHANGHANGTVKLANGTSNGQVSPKKETNSGKLIHLSTKPKTETNSKK